MHSESGFTKLHKNHCQTSDKGLAAFLIYLNPSCQLFRVEREPNGPDWLLGLILEQAEFDELKALYHNPETTIANVPKFAEAFETVIRFIDFGIERGGRYTAQIRN